MPPGDPSRPARPAAVDRREALLDVARALVHGRPGRHRSLLAQARSQPGEAEPRSLVDTDVEMTIGGLQRPAARPG